MQAQTTSRQPSNILAWMIAAFGVVLMALLLLSFMADSQPPAAGDAGATGNRVAYLQFGLKADTLRLSDPAMPGDPRDLLTIPHASEYGILPAISPDGSEFAYTLLPEGLASSRPDSPAELWVTMIQDPEPRLLAEGIDLLVPPVWTPDGEYVVYRRSDAGEHTLAMIGVNAGEERVLATSGEESLFPVGFVRGGSHLLFTGMSEDRGSHLYQVDVNSGVRTDIAELSPGMTREWSLSADGAWLAFLEIALTESEVASRASIFGLATGSLTRVTSVNEAAFGPTWTSETELAVGTFNKGTGDASLLIVNGESEVRIEGPATGFDVPHAFDQAAAAYLVSSFENSSITSPGRSVLTLVSADGERTTIAEGEVTLVGWTHP